MHHTFENIDLAGLRRLAATLASEPTRRMSIGLTGTLGAGKTTFVQSLAESFGIDPAEVTSPTFTLQQTYVGDGDKPTLHHLDAYRIDDLDAWDELGVDELHETDNQWVVIEWADRVRTTMPPETLWIEIAIASVDRRSIQVDGGPDGVLHRWIRSMESYDR